MRASEFVDSSRPGLYYLLVEGRRRLHSYPRNVKTNFGKEITGEDILLLSIETCSPRIKRIQGVEHAIVPISAKRQVWERRRKENLSAYRVYYGGERLK